MERKFYEEVPVERELPPLSSSEQFIFKYSGKGSWFEDEIGVMYANEIHGYHESGLIKSWLKPVDEKDIPLL